MTMTVCMCTLVPRPFVVEKPIRNAVTVGLLAHSFMAGLFDDVISSPSMAYPTVHTRRMDDLWSAFVPIGKKERSV